MEYKITNVPMVSDFKTSTIRRRRYFPEIQYRQPEKLFSGWYGNYSKFLADGNISSVRQKYRSGNRRSRNHYEQV